MRHNRPKPILISQPVLTSSSNMLHDARHYGPEVQTPALDEAKRRGFNVKGLSLLTPSPLLPPSLPWLPASQRSALTPVTPSNRTRTSFGQTPTGPIPSAVTPAPRTPLAPIKLFRNRTSSIFESPAMKRPYKQSGDSTRAETTPSKIVCETVDPNQAPERDFELESHWSSSEDEDSDSGYTPSWLSRRRSGSSRRAATPSIRSISSRRVAAPSIRSVNTMKSSAASIRSFCSGTTSSSRCGTPLPSITSSEPDSPDSGVTARRGRRILGSLRNHLTPRKRQQLPPPVELPPAPLERHIPDNWSLPSRNRQRTSSSSTTSTIHARSVSKNGTKRPRIPAFDPPPLSRPCTPSITPKRPPRPPSLDFADTASVHAVEPVRTMDEKNKNNTHGSTSRAEGQRLVLMNALPGRSDAYQNKARSRAGTNTDQPRQLESHHTNATGHHDMYLHGNNHVDVPQSQRSRASTKASLDFDTISRSSFQLPLDRPPRSTVATSQRSSSLATRHISKAKSLLSRHPSDGPIGPPPCPFFDDDIFNAEPRCASGPSRRTTDLSRTSFVPPFRSVESSPDIPVLTPDVTHSSFSSISSLESVEDPNTRTDPPSPSPDSPSPDADTEPSFRIQIGEPIPPARRNTSLPDKLKLQAFTLPLTVPDEPVPPISPGGLRCPRRGKITPVTTPKRENFEIPPHLVHTPLVSVSSQSQLDLLDLDTREERKEPEGMYLSSNASVHTFGTGVDFSQPMNW